MGFSKDSCTVCYLVLKIKKILWKVVGAPKLTWRTLIRSTKSQKFQFYNIYIYIYIYYGLGSQG